MFKKIAVGTTFLAAALAIQPTAAQAQDRYYGDANNYGGAYNYGYAGSERYEHDRYLDHEARERHERWERRERERAFREHERRERLEHQYQYGDSYWRR